MTSTQWTATVFPLENFSRQTAVHSTFGFRQTPGCFDSRRTITKPILGPSLKPPADGTKPHTIFQGGLRLPGLQTDGFSFFRTGPTSDWISGLRRNGAVSLGGSEMISQCRLTAGPLNFEYPLPSKDGKQIFAIGGSSQAEVIRYDARSRQFVPYLSGISAEGLAFSQDGQWVTYTSFPMARYGEAKWMEVSGVSLPFRPCGFFCRAGRPTANKSLSMPFFPVRPECLPRLERRWYSADVYSPVKRVRRM